MTARGRRCALVLALAVPLLAWRVLAIVSRGPATAGAATAAGSGALEGGAVGAAGAARSAVGAGRSAVGGAASAALMELQRKRLSVAWGRDPFAPVTGSPVGAAPVAAAESRTAPHWNLTGISHVRGRYVAILGGQVVREGDVLEGGYRVTEVSARRVTVGRGEQAHTYELGEREVRTREVGHAPNEGPAPIEDEDDDS